MEQRPFWPPQRKIPPNTTQSIPAAWQSTEPNSVATRSILRSYSLCETLRQVNDQHRHGVDTAQGFISDIYPIVLWRWVDRKMFNDIWPLVESRNKRSFTVVDASAVTCIRERPGSLCVAIDDDLDGFGFEVYPKL